MEGLEVGVQRRVLVAPKEGCGERHEGRQQKVPLDAFNGETPTVGDEFYAAGPDGMPMPVQVVAVQGREVTIDLNHPLAGKTLHFSIEVKEVRAATAEEAKHGHGHGPDGHGHHDEDEDEGSDHDHDACGHDHSHDDGACGHDHSGSHDPKSCGHDHSHDACDHHHH